MSIYNGTCMISNLPIFHKEKVKLIFLIQQPQNENAEGVGSHLIDAYYQTAFFPINGTYDSLGSIRGKKVNTHIWNAITEKIKEGIVIDTAGNMKEVENFEQFLDRVKSGSIKIQHGQSQYQMGCVLIKEEIYNLIWEEASKRHTYNIDPLRNQLLERWDSPKRLEYLFKKDDSHLGYFITKEFAFGELMYQYAKKQKNRKLVEEYLQFYLFHLGMGLARKSWYLPTGIGSQQDEMYIQKLLAHKIIDLERERKEAGYDTRENVW